MLEHSTAPHKLHYGPLLFSQMDCMRKEKNNQQASKVAHNQQACKVGQSTSK